MPDALTGHQQEAVEFYRSQWVFLHLQCVFSPLLMHTGAMQSPNPHQVQILTA